MPVDADDILLAACHRAFKDIGSTFEGAEDYFDKETLESIAKHWDNLWNEILEEREGFRTAKAACENAIKNAKEKKAKYASAIVAAESEYADAGKALR